MNTRVHLALLAAGAISALVISGILVRPAVAAAPQSANELLRVELLTSNYVNDGVVFGPGTVDDSALGATAGPWSILPAGSWNLTVQNLGDKTVRFALTNGTHVFDLPGGQSRGRVVSVPMNEDLSVSFTGSGAVGRVIWCAR